MKFLTSLEQEDLSNDDKKVRTMVGKYDAAEINDGLTGELVGKEG